MTYFSEKVVKEDLPEDALLLTRMDVQRILRISRSVFDSIKRAGGWDSATVAFGRAFRYRREFIEKVARGEVVLPSAPPPRHSRMTWQQQAREAASIRSIKAAERRAAKEEENARAEAEGTRSNFRKSSLTEVDRRKGKKGGAK